MREVLGCYVAGGKILLAKIHFLFDFRYPNLDIEAYTPLVPSLSS